MSNTGGYFDVIARIKELEETLASREATLDAISYKCADFDVEYSMADSMLDDDENDPVDMRLSNTRSRSFHEGQYKAGAEIDKLIAASGYKVKDRPEEEGS